MLDVLITGITLLRRAHDALAAQAVNNPALVKAGMVFVMDHDGSLGHTELVEKVKGGLMTTSEGIPLPVGLGKAAACIACRAS